MRIFSSIVLPSPALVAPFHPEIVKRSAVCSQVVGDQSLWNGSVLLQKLTHQLQRCVLVSPGLVQHIENLAFGVDSPPKVDHPAVDLQIDFIQMPCCVRSRSTLSQVGGDHRSEVVHPTPNGLIRDRDPALREQILDVTKAECEPKIEPNRLMYGLWGEPISG
jgi:hypothetical protein